LQAAFTTEASETYLSKTAVDLIGFDEEPMIKVSYLLIFLKASPVYSYRKCLLDINWLIQ
ncbi:MAG: hypothetical protein KAJ15_02340, partial [Spirochaetes bacterium]|nr:hypothetical protein [Spirochaetota bacterium]